METIDEPCPKRASSVIKARSLFTKALHVSDNKEKPSPDNPADAKKLAEEMRNDRIRMYVNFATELDCPGGLH